MKIFVGGFFWYRDFLICYKEIKKIYFGELRQDKMKLGEMSIGLLRQSEQRQNEIRESDLKWNIMKWIENLHEIRLNVAWINEIIQVRASAAFVCEALYKCTLLLGELR